MGKEIYTSSSSVKELSPTAWEFVTHFGDMGSKWGINRITAQVFALLYLSPMPMSAAEICKLLNFSRSHVGAALKDLGQWHLLIANRPPGARNDYFSAVEDVWEIARILVEERRNREIEPTRAMLNRAVATKPKSQEEKYMHDKIKQMNDLLHMLTNWYNDMQNMETKQLLRLIKLGSKVMSFYAKSNAKGKKK